MRRAGLPYRWGELGAGELVTTGASSTARTSAARGSGRLRSKPNGYVNPMAMTATELMARDQLGWSLTEAAEQLGITRRPYIYL